MYCTCKKGIKNKKDKKTEIYRLNTQTNFGECNFKKTEDTIK
jgi:hypothetical protein